MFFSNNILKKLLIFTIITFAFRFEVNALMYDHPKLQRPTRTEYERHIKDVYYEQMVEQLKAQRKVKRVLKGELEGKEEVFLSSFSSPEIGKYVMAVIVAESGGGKYKCGNFNYSGIMKNGKCENFNSLESYINDGIKKRTGKYFNTLYRHGVSHQTLNDIFIGQGKYCTSSCEHWVDNFLFTYNKL